MNASPVLNVNVACLACDGARPCAECRAAGKAVAAAGHRVHYSSRYAALRAAADGTYGFSACIVAVKTGEQRIADAIVSLFPSARVALAIDDATQLPADLPAQFVTFSLADYIAGKLPRAWLDSLATNDADVRARGKAEISRVNAAAPVQPRTDATRRLRSALRSNVVVVGDRAKLIGDELAWYRASGIGFALVSISLPEVSAERLATSIVPLVRSGDAVATSETQCLVTLAGANEEQARPIATRVVTAAAKALGVKRRDAAVAVAVCPQDGDTVDKLLARLRM